MSSLASKKSSKRHAQGHNEGYQGLEAWRSIWRCLLDHIASFLFTLWQGLGVIFQRDARHSGDMSQRTLRSDDTDSDDSSDSDFAPFTESESQDSLSSEEDSLSSDYELHSTSSSFDLSAAATSRKRARHGNAQWDTGSSHQHRCRVYIWTKPTIKYACFASNRGMKKTSSPCVEHWMAAFEYEDEVLVCDAVEYNGELTGRCRSKMKTEFHNKYPEKHTLCGVHMHQVRRFKTKARVSCFPMMM
ncbi:uncharacterized protein LOC144139465 [Haemaphysalis longicornis]